MPVDWENITKAKMSEGSRTDNPSKFGMKFAADNGLYVLIPKKYQLFIDIDNPKIPVGFVDMCERVDDMFGIKKIRFTRSKSGNLHVIVDLYQKLPAERRIILQQYLMSDPVREVLSLVRLEAEDPNPIMLFETKFPPEFIEPQYELRRDTKPIKTVDDFFTEQPKRKLMRKKKEAK